MIKISAIQNFINLLYPNICETCNNTLVRGEEMICTACSVDLPITSFWESKNNKIEQIFWGRVICESACSFFFFEKGSRYRVLIHKLKYKRRPDIGVTLGRWFGRELALSENFCDIDLIVPVPLHPKKKRARGYNQSELICKGMGESMNKPVIVNNLIRSQFTETQTKKNRMERWQNVSGVFRLVDAIEFENKHILLVDDVLTTGATLEACCIAVQNQVDCKISIATIAYAQ